MLLTSLSKGFGIPYQSNLRTTTVPAPTFGWDAKYPLAQMPPDHAVVLDNFVPQTGYIEPRRGFIEWATGVGTASTPVQTIMTYYAGNPANDKMFAVAGGTIYNVTSSGAASATTVTGLLQSRCQFVNFTNVGGTHYLIVCNGVDTPRIFDGTTWTTMTLTGVTPSTLVQPYVFQNRLWFVQINTLSVWYLAVTAISGALTEFNVGPYALEGGYLEAMSSWTVDTRQNVNDYAAFITSRGQVIVYAGTDPADADSWTLVGIYMTGRPIGRRCATKIGGDLAIISVDGISSMNTLLIADRAGQKRQAITDRISGAIAQATSSYADNFGWEFFVYPTGNLAILNIPVTENSEQMQFAMNTLTGAWCRFLGISGNCWELFGDLAYFGGNNGTVYLWDYGASDDGMDINCTAKTAFNYFGSRGNTKRFTMLRPVFTTDQQVQPGTGINVDFGQGGVVSTPNVVTGTLATWDQSLWDDAVWPVENATVIDWVTVSGIGHCASIITQVATNSDNALGVTLQLNSWDIMMEPGGPL